MICWLLLYGATDRDLKKSQWVACFLNWVPKGSSKPVEKIKRELKMLCKHQDNCERELNVIGRRSKARDNCFWSYGNKNGLNQTMLTNRYLREKEALLSASSIYTQACATWCRQYSYLDFINEEVNGWSMWGKSGLRFSWRQRGPAWLNSFQMAALSNLGLWSQ